MPLDITPCHITYYNITQHMIAYKKNNITLQNRTCDVKDIIIDQHSVFVTLSVCLSGSLLSMLLCLCLLSMSMFMTYLFMCRICVCVSVLSVCSLVSCAVVVVLLFCCALSVCNVCFPSCCSFVWLLMPVGVFHMYACLIVETYARVWLFMCLCVYNVEFFRRCVSLCMYLLVYMQMYMCVWSVHVYMYVHVKVRVYLNG